MPVVSDAAFILRTILGLEQPILGWPALLADERDHGALSLIGGKR
jgi:hypothetical protein